MNWEMDIKTFGQYLKLERSLSANSIEAYVHDVELLYQFMNMTYPGVSPVKVTTKHIQGFLQHINELGLSAHSQARILSGLKGFFKYLFFEDQFSHQRTSLQ